MNSPDRLIHSQQGEEVQEEGEKDGDVDCSNAPNLLEPELCLVKEEKHSEDEDSPEKDDVMTPEPCNLDPLAHVKVEHDEEEPNEDEGPMDLDEVTLDPLAHVKVEQLEGAPIQDSISGEIEDCKSMPFEEKEENIDDVHEDPLGDSQLLAKPSCSVKRKQDLDNSELDLMKMKIVKEDMMRILPLSAEKRKVCTYDCPMISNSNNKLKRSNLNPNKVTSKNNRTKVNKKTDLTSKLLSSKRKENRSSKCNSPKPRPKKFSCTLCEFKSCRNSNLIEHLRIHSGQRPFICSHCNYRSARKTMLRIHIERTHLKFKPFACDKCKYTSAKKSDLMMHIRTHSAYKPFSCNHCDFKSISKSGLNRHMKYHTGETRFECEHCDFKTWYKNKLITHTRTHLREKLHTCDLCDSRSYRSDQVTVHTKNMHKREDPVEPFSCDLADQIKSKFYSIGSSLKSVGISNLLQSMKSKGTVTK